MARQPWMITRDMFLSVEEVRRLVANLRETAPGATHPDESAVLDRVVVETLLWSGLRSSEFCNLLLGDAHVDDARPRLAVRQRGRVSREVFIPPGLAELIAGYIEVVRPRLRPERGRRTGSKEALFFSERRRPFERTGLYRRVVAVLERASLGERASVQLLRHTYGYLAYLQTGGNLLFVQRQLGHSHPMVTAVYAQFVEENETALAMRVAQVVEHVAGGKGPRTSRVRGAKAGTGW